MMFSVNDTIGYQIGAADGDVGSLRDVLFDDATSAVRYLVIETGSWLVGRRVLLSPAALGPLEPAQRRIPSALTQEQVKDSPGVDADKPVSRQAETALHRYYGWEPYWEGTTAAGLAPFWGGVALPPDRPSLADSGVAQEVADAEGQRADRHLHSAREVVGYAIAAADGEIGHVEDLLVDDRDWSIRLIVIDTRNWLPGRKVVVAPDWLVRVDWAGHQIVLDLRKEQISSSPAYDPSVPTDGRYGEALYAHYGRRPAGPDRSQRLGGHGMTLDERQLEKAMLDPAAVFGSPEAVVERPDLTSAQKVALLRRWLQDARELSVAEGEGMAGGEPSLIERVSAAALAEEHKLQEQVERHADGDPDAYLNGARAELKALDAQIASLQQRRAEVSARIRELGAASEEVLDDLRNGLQKATDGVRDAVKTTVGRLR